MTVEVFLSLLAFFSVVTSLFTEAVKKLLDSLGITYASNVVVLLVSALVGGGGTAIFYELMCCIWTSMHVICIFLMICANWLCSMVGYDKVIQAVTQAKNTK